MAEQILQIENVDPKDLYGPNNKYLDKVKALFPKLKIIARGDFVKVMGDEEEETDSTKKLRPIATMMTATTTPATYSNRPCPKGCSRSAGFAASLNPKTVMTELPASARLFTASVAGPDGARILYEIVAK